MLRKADKLMVSGVKGYPFTRTTFAGTIASSTTAITVGSYNFQLGLLPAATEFSTLYDQYRICAVRLQFIPRASESPVASSNNVSQLFVVPDYDDSIPPTSVTDLLQYPSCKIVRPLYPWKMYLKPKVNTTMGGTPSAPTGLSSTRGWIDCAYANVEHYGVKYAWPQTSVTQYIDVYVKYYILCRYPR